MSEAEMKAVDIHTGLDSTLMILQNRLDAKHGRSPIEVIKQYSPLPLVECYPGELNQVFLQILSNAIDAFDEFDNQSLCGETRIRANTITISTAFTEGIYVTIKIADNGVGMPEEVRKKIFDPFFTTKPVGKGTGLGLAICHSIIVEKHDGKIECASELGKGTEFSIFIPLHQRSKT